MFRSLFIGVFSRAGYVIVLGIANVSALFARVKSLQIYVISFGLSLQTELITFENSLTLKSQYRLYQVCYQVRAAT